MSYALVLYVILFAITVPIWILVIPLGRIDMKKEPEELALISFPWCVVNCVIGTRRDTVCEIRCPKKFKDPTKESYDQQRTQSNSQDR